jgi:Mg-chelatase subunit ChlD
MRTKKNRGSLLVVSLVIISMILVIALSLASSSVKNRQSSIGSGRSVQSFQYADNGIESVLTAIKANPTSIDLIDDGITGALCNAVTGEIEKLPDYRVELSDNDGNKVMCDNTTDPIAKIVRIKSTGKEVAGKVRSIEAAVVMEDSPLLDADVIFVLDRSNSVADADYDIMVDAVKDFINDIAHTDCQVGINVFSDDVTDELELIPALSDPANFSLRINNFLESSKLLPKGMTNTAKAIEQAKVEMISNGRIGNRQAIILLTDGAPNSPANWSIPHCRELTALCTPAPSYWNTCDESLVRIATQSARDAGILIYSTGIGFGGLASLNCQSRAETLLQTISDRYFLIDDFSQIKDALDSI